MFGVAALKDQLAELGISIDTLRARGMPRQEVPTSLEVAEVGTDGREHKMVPSAAQAWRAMKAQALLDGEEIFIVSAFRSIERQIEIIRRKLESGTSIERILSVSAPPGYSEHHTGRAVDLSTPGVPLLDLEFGRTSAFEWLQNNANRFNFALSYPAGNSYGFAYEPWHWCYRNSA